MYLSLVKRGPVRIVLTTLAALVLTAVLAIGFPAKVLAADDSAVGIITLAPGFENIGVMASFTGDDNGNNSTILEYRAAGSSTWIRGVDMTADRRDNLVQYNENGPDIEIPNPYKDQFRGVIFGLTANTEYEVRVTYSDPDGITGPGSATATTTTRNDNPQLDGVTYYVSPTGDDIINDGSFGHPWLTIQRAADAVAAGDTVRVMPGTYSGGIDITASGTPTEYITFESFNFNNKAVVTGGSWNFRLMGSYIRLRGFDLRSPVGDPAANVAVGWEDGPTVSDNIIEDCIITDPPPDVWGSAGVLLRDSKNTLIQRNIIQTTEVEARGSSYGIFFWGTGVHGGNVIRNNQIISRGTFRDSIGGGGNFGIENGPGPNSFIYGNYCYGSYDDGIESEGGNMNVAIFNNTIEAYPDGPEETHMIAGIAMASVVVGPFYAVRNTFISPRQTAFKAGSSSYGSAYIYHNTAVGPAYGLIFSSGNNRICENMTIRNNIASVAGRVMGHYTDTIPPGEQTDTWDYDALYSAEWNGWFYGIRYFSLAELQAAGHEIHGIDGNPLFMNPAGHDYRLQSTSPCIDAGVVIPGFNDADSPWPYNGDAPDMGALEYTPPQNLNPGGGGGGGGGAPGLVTIFDKLTPDGVLSADVRVAAANIKAYLIIPKGTVCLAREGSPLSWVYLKLMSDNESHPDIPEEFTLVTSLYDLSPEGATFDPPITLTFEYDPSAIPPGMSEDNLFVATWDETAGQWVFFDSVIDTENQTISTVISHFSIYTVMARTRPADIVPTKISLPTDDIYEGDSVDVNVSLVNSGDETGEYEVALKVDGDARETKVATVTGGESTSVSFTLKGIPAGTYRLEVGRLTRELTVLPAPIPPEAVFSISDLSISPEAINISNEVIISVLLTNTGEIEGDYEVIFKVDDTIITEDIAELPAGASQTVSITFKPEGIGRHNVSVGDLLGFFIVREPLLPPQPTPAITEQPQPDITPIAPPEQDIDNTNQDGNAVIYYVIIPGVLIIAGVAFFLVRRSRANRPG